jgi:hypothetical protein
MVTISPAFYSVEKVAATVLQNPGLTAEKINDSGSSIIENRYFFMVRLLIILTYLKMILNLQMAFPFSTQLCIHVLVKMFKGSTGQIF